MPDAQKFRRGKGRAGRRRTCGQHTKNRSPPNVSLCELRQGRKQRSSAARRSCMCLISSTAGAQPLVPKQFPLGNARTSPSAVRLRTPALAQCGPTQRCCSASAQQCAAQPGQTDIRHRCVLADKILVFCFHSSQGCAREARVPSPSSKGQVSPPQANLPVTHVISQDLICDVGGPFPLPLTHQDHRDDRPRRIPERASPFLISPSP